MSFTQKETLTIKRGETSAFSYLPQQRWMRGGFLQRQGIDVHQPLQLAGYYAYSIWLFTFNDIKTIVGPSFLFALATSPALSVFGMRNAALVDLLRRAPLALFWLWINLLPFTIDNQRHPDSIAEDMINKPWRTMPSKRMTPQQARNLVLVLYVLAIITSFRIGGLEQCLSLVVAGVWYNNFQGAEGILSRHLINAFGYRCFNSGALEVVLGGRGSYSSSTSLLVWETIISGLVFTTIHTTDMYDQEGDALRNRKTIPLVIGDNLGRWSLASFLIIWSVVCPVYIGAPLVGFALMLGLGGLISARYLILRTIADDKKTVKLWNLFVVGIYILPLMRLAAG
jgi:4-hydroxybenzoate polyprenyltransferase